MFLANVCNFSLAWSAIFVRLVTTYLLIAGCERPANQGTQPRHYELGFSPSLGHLVFHQALVTWLHDSYENQRI
jgi:hypothetical protein